MHQHGFFVENDHEKRFGNSYLEPTPDYNHEESLRQIEQSEFRKDVLNAVETKPPR